jgi:signal peptidase II
VLRKSVVLLVVALSVVLLDQWTKYLVLGGLTTAFDRANSLGDRVKIFLSDAPPPPFPGAHHFTAKRPIVLSESFFRLGYAENPGAAWGLFRDLPPQYRGPLFHVVSLGAVALIGYYFSKLTGARSERFALWGLCLVLGGALGNYIDRLARGFVIDFLDAHWFDRYHWPSFNVADAGIVIGVGCLFIDALVRREKPQEA